MSMPLGMVGRGEVYSDPGFATPAEVLWHGAHTLKGDFSGVYEPEPPPLPFLSPDRCQAVLAGMRRHVTEARYFTWLDAIKPYAYLESMLGSIPSRFAETFDID